MIENTSDNYKVKQIYQNSSNDLHNQCGMIVPFPYHLIYNILLISLLGICSITALVTIKSIEFSLISVKAALRGASYTEFLCLNKNIVITIFYVKPNNKEDICEQYTKEKSGTAQEMLYRNSIIQQLKVTP